MPIRRIRWRRTQCLESAMRLEPGEINLLENATARHSQAR